MGKKWRTWSAKGGVSVNRMRERERECHFQSGGDAEKGVKLDPSRDLVPKAECVARRFFDLRPSPEGSLFISPSISLNSA